MQGSAHTGRVGSNARFISIVGLGKKEAAPVNADWGASAYQVGFLLCTDHLGWMLQLSVLLQTAPLLPLSVSHVITSHVLCKDMRTSVLMQVSVIYCAQLLTNTHELHGRPSGSWAPGRACSHVCNLDHSNRKLFDANQAYLPMRGQCCARYSLLAIR